MGRKRTVTSEYVSPAEMIQRIDKAIRDRRSSPAEILKLQRRRGRVMKEMIAQQNAQPADPPPGEFTSAQQKFLNQLTGDDYGIKKERELWEGVYRAENARWAAFYARLTGGATPDKTEPLSTPVLQDIYKPSEQFPTAQDPVTQFIQHAASLRLQGLDPAEVISKFDQSHQPQELKHETE